MKIIRAILYSLTLATGHGQVLMAMKACPIDIEETLDLLRKDMRSLQNSQNIQKIDDRYLAQREQAKLEANAPFIEIAPPEEHLKNNDSLEERALSYTRILKRIPCWFGTKFDFDSCSFCEAYAVSLIRSPDKETPLEECCECCGALFYHYTLTFYPLDTISLVPTRFILPNSAAEEIAPRVFRDDPCLYAQIFIESPGDQLIIRSYSWDNKAYLNAFLSELSDDLTQAIQIDRQVVYAAGYYKIVSPPISKDQH